MANNRKLYRFLLLYALAWAGCSVAYVPFLTILLPVRVTAMADQGQDITWMAYIALSGAVSASIGHIGFGYLSDITRNRRGWIAGGLILSCGILFAVSLATSLAGLIVLVVCWQLALNMMLAPLAAWAGDCVPDHQKGLLGGLMAFAPGLGALSGAAVTLPGVASPDTRLAVIAALVMACVVPALIAGPPDERKQPDMEKAVGGKHTFLSHRAIQRMWIARLAVQVAEAALFSYLLFWFRSIDPMISDNQTARVFSVVLILSAPLALLVGGWADRRNRPVLPLVVSALISAVALFGMATSKSLPSAIATYAVFGIASSVFLALHSAQTLRFLPRADRRGRDLGLFNLTNTLPSLIMPWLALVLVPGFGFSGLFIVLAGLALFAGILLSRLIACT